MPWPYLTVAVLAAIVINEVLFDPPGTDAGHEFVELYNPGPDAVDLVDFALHFVNGSAPTSPDVVWTGDPHVLDADAFFVVGGDQVGERDRTASLGLQNGDEALRLVRSGVVIDAVAWGEDLGLAEGATVEGGRGVSVGRVPDGNDTDENRSDFRELPGPTPGRVNLPAQRFDLVAWWTEPAWREDAGPIRLHARLVASGWSDRQQGAVELWGSRRELVAASGDTVAVEFSTEVAPGPVGTSLIVVSDGSTAAAGPGRIRCGTDRLVLTEVQPRPAEGEPEWFEVLNRSDLPLDLEGWAVRDRAGAARALAAGVFVGPGERVVFTADAGRLAAIHAPHAPVLEPAGGWPTLNDTDPGGDVAADSLHLIAPGGEVVDLVTWVRADIDERGRSLQRSRIQPGQVSLWLPSVDGASPGSPGDGEARVWPVAGMSCLPDPFTPDGDGSRDALEVLLTGVRVRRISVFDLQGDLVRELEAIRAGDRAVARWDGTDGRGRPVPAGAWVVVAELEAPAGLLRRVVGLGRAR